MPPTGRVGTVTDKSSGQEYCPEPLVWWGCRGDKPQGSPEMLVGALAEVIGTAGVLRVAGFDVGGSHAGHHFGELLH